MRNSQSSYTFSTANPTTVTGAFAGKSPFLRYLPPSTSRAVAFTCGICFFFSSRRRHTSFDCDWSSDVCSPDLLVGGPRVDLARPGLHRHAGDLQHWPGHRQRRAALAQTPLALHHRRCQRHHRERADRKSGVLGKSVDLGGRRIIKKKKKKK